MKKNFSFFAVFVWSIAILFFFYEFFLRIFLGTIATEVMTDLHLTIEQFSLIGAGYYITYGLMQTPVGILTERIGARTVLSAACAICTLGVFWLAVSSSFLPAFFSRLLIGFGSSFAFVSLLILALNWFPKEFFGFLCGIALFLGSVGPMLAGAPLAYVSQLLNGNWRLILLWIGSFGILLSVCLAIFIRNNPKESREQIIFITPQESLIQKLFQLLKNGQVWLVLACTSALYVSLPLMAAYWGTTYLQTRGLDKTKAAFVISMIWIGYAIGSPLVGKLSDRIKRRKPFLVILSCLGLVVSSIILYTPVNQYGLFIFLFFLMGFSSAAQALAYAVTVEHTPEKLHSSALGLMNTATMLTAALIPSIASFLIQNSLQSSHSGFLTRSHFLEGLSLMPLAYGLASLIALFGIKETFCRQQNEILKVQIHKASDLF